MESVCFSEASLKFYHFIWRHNPVDSEDFGLQRQDPTWAGRWLLTFRKNPWHPPALFFYPEDAPSKVNLNINKNLPHYMTSCLRRQKPLLYIDIRSSNKRWVK
jgi:hypothetical protein